jgi:hypothetical protein
VTLRLIGYWCSLEVDWPDPARFVDPAWDPAVRIAVVSYLRLRGGRAPWNSVGYSWCRFRCEMRRRVGTGEYTDGTYIWPEGLAHYVEQHGVRLPDEFVSHVLKDSSVPLATPSKPLRWGDVRIETDWWMAQRGWIEASAFRTPGLYGRVSKIQATCCLEVSAEQLGVLQQFGGSRPIDMEDLDRLHRDGQPILLAGNCDSDQYELLVDRARELGLEISCEPATPNIEDDPTKSLDLGDSVRFSRPNPFGPPKNHVWTRKKSDLDTYERSIWERDRDQVANEAEIKRDPGPGQGILGIPDHKFDAT